jgi:hypothetical protein
VIMSTAEEARDLDLHYGSRPHMYDLAAQLRGHGLRRRDERPHPGLLTAGQPPDPQMTGHDGLMVAGRLPRQLLHDQIVRRAGHRLDELPPGHGAVRFGNRVLRFPPPASVAATE